LVTINLSVLGIVYSGEKPNSFSVILVACSVRCFGVVLMLFVRTSNQETDADGCPQKGAFTGGKQQENSSLPNFFPIPLIIRDSIDQQQTGVPRPPTDTGPGYRRSRKHLTIGNTYVCVFNLSRPKPRWVFNLSRPNLVNEPFLKNIFYSNLINKLLTQFHFKINYNII
jgi:hypothetical protein